MPPPVKIQPPTGTRDLYPLEAAKRRFITEAWRKVSINHGFEEIDGPTFEHLELYTVKSGEGIVNELFSFTRAGGEKDYALRPEFTPTLARMYAARANSLPKPTKWFSVGPYFRAERPQRGRLREFLQWNVDAVGGAATPQEQAELDADVISCCAHLLQALGLTAREARITIGSRPMATGILFAIGVAERFHSAALSLIDGRSKLDPSDANAQARHYGFSFQEFDEFAEQVKQIAFESDARGSPIWNKIATQMRGRIDPTPIFLAHMAMDERGLGKWVHWDPSIVRGLAYYTGMVFEVVVDGERAVAGGGRYDNLIELFGGPPTPAVGFGMGDVVLSLVLQDKGLMPSDAELLEKAGLRPDAFVIADAGRDATDEQRAAIDAQIRPTVAALRRAGLHARHSYKSTKNIGKLLEEASKLRARFAVIIDSPETAKIKDLTTNTQDEAATKLADLPDVLTKRLSPR